MRAQWKKKTSENKYRPKFFLAKKYCCLRMFWSVFCSDFFFIKNGAKKQFFVQKFSIFFKWPYYRPHICERFRPLSGTPPPGRGCFGIETLANWFTDIYPLHPCLPTSWMTLIRMLNIFQKMVCVYCHYLISISLWWNNLDLISWIT